MANRHGSPRENANGLLLLTLCSEEDLTITNTLFKQPETHKVTWMHPRSKHWHLIDDVITRRRDIRDILVTRAMRGATAGPTMCCLGAGQLSSWRVSTAVKPAARRRSST